MVRKRKFHHDDLEVWSRVRSSVTPISVRQKHRDIASVNSQSREEKSRPVPEKKQAQQKIELLPISAVPGEGVHRAKFEINLRPKAPQSSIDGLHRTQRRAIKRGSLEPSSRLDLHGMYLEEARERLVRFLTNSAYEGHRVVLVITGKGGYKRLSEWGSETSGVIRRAFPSWLHEHDLSRIVSHFTPAHNKHGGDGAWYVFIRANTHRKKSR